MKMMPESDARLTVEQALAMLPDGDEIHTFFNPQVNMLIGADCERVSVVAAIRKASVRKLTGPEAMSMGHGIAVEFDGSWLFVKTRSMEVLT